MVTLNTKDKNEHFVSQPGFIDNELYNSLLHFTRGSNFKQWPVVSKAL